MPPEASSSCTTYRARGASASARPAATPDRGGLLEMDTVDIIVAALPARPRNGHQYTLYRFLPLHAAGAEAMLRTIVCTSGSDRTAPSRCETSATRVMWRIDQLAPGHGAFATGIVGVAAGIVGIMDIPGGQGPASAQGIIVGAAGGPAAASSGAAGALGCAGAPSQGTAGPAGIGAGGGRTNRSIVPSPEHAP